VRNATFAFPSASKGQLKIISSAVMIWFWLKWNPSQPVNYGLLWPRFIWAKTNLGHDQKSMRMKLAGPHGSDARRRLSFSTGRCGKEDHGPAGEKASLCRECRF